MKKGVKKNAIAYALMYKQFQQKIVKPKKGKGSYIREKICRT